MTDVKITSSDGKLVLTYVDTAGNVGNAALTQTKVAGAEIGSTVGASVTGKTEETTPGVNKVEATVTGVGSEKTAGVAAVTATVTGNVAETTKGVDDTTPEVQTVTLSGSLAEGDVFTLKISDTVTLTTAALGATPNLDALVTALTGADGYANSGVTIAADGSTGFTVTWAANGDQEDVVFTQTKVAGKDVTEGSGEVQQIVLNGTLAVGDEYTVTLCDGKTTIDSGALAAATVDDLAAKLDAAKGANKVAFSASDGNLIITYEEAGDQANTCSIEQTKVAGSTISAGTAEVQTITITGTPAVGDEYTLTLADGTEIKSGALTTASVEDLADKLTAAYKGDALTIDDSGSTLVITYAKAGAVDGLASIQQTSKEGTELGTVAVTVTGECKATTEGVDPSVTAASDSTPTAFDVITNFDVTNDKILLPNGETTMTDGATAIDGDTVTITSGVATFASASTASAKITALLTAMTTKGNVAAFVDGTDTYVAYSDGIAGATDADIVVKLAGVDDATTAISAIQADA